MNDAAHRLFFMLGASHHTTPLELRERLALTADKVEPFFQRLSQLSGLKEIAVVNTCNRVEFYGVAETPDVVDRLQRTFCDFQGFPPGEFSALRQQATGRQALQHLLEVSSGLDSQMLGETEILGQVKDAYADAVQRRTAGPTLNRVFQKTFQSAKYVRSHTRITEGQISVANVAVELAQKIFGNLSRTRILLLGAGEIGEKTAKAFISRGGQGLTVASRTLGRAMELATSLDAKAMPFENFSNHLSEFDVVVCTTAAPNAVITADDVAAAMKKRRALPLFLIDLALPRDVEAAVANVENVFVYNLDHLAKIAEENLAARRGEVSKAREILQERAAALWKQVEPLVPAEINSPGLPQARISEA